MVIQLLKLIRDVAIKPPAKDAVLLASGAFETHYSESAGLVAAVRVIVENPEGLLSWSKDTGLKLPDKRVGDVVTLGEVWVWAHGLKIYTFQSVKCRTLQHKIENLCWGWVRHGSQWRGANYNNNPQPHGDEPVRTYQYERVLKLIAMLQSDRSGY